MHVHLVRPGDTLAEIARGYRVTPERLSRSNDLPPAPFLLPGQSLCIPAQFDIEGTDGFTTYLVQPGDTPRRIAASCGIPLTWLSLCNLLASESVRPGEVLLLPQTDRRDAPQGPPFRLLAFEPLRAGDGRPLPLTYHASDSLRIDASGEPHLTERPAANAPVLLVCRPGGAANILHDVSKAILQSDGAKQRLLDRLAGLLAGFNARGLIWHWDALRPETEASYLALVREAGLRLRPMGFEVGLHLTSDSPLLRRHKELPRTVQALDHVFFAPRPLPPERGKRRPQPKPPAPLVGADDLRYSLQRAAKLWPAEKTWLVLHPLGLAMQGANTAWRMSPHQALGLAVRHGVPLAREEQSGLPWFRVPGGEEGYTVWMEDLFSLVRKMELLQQMKLQGLACWEAGGYFPEAWTYVCEELQRKESSVSE